MSNQPNPESEESDSSQGNQHILIIDDDVEVTESIRQALIAAGYSVSVALDGNQGLAYTEAKSPDLLILDIMYRAGVRRVVRWAFRDVSSPYPPHIAVRDG